MPIPQSDTRCSAGEASSRHPIKASLCFLLPDLFDTLDPLLSPSVNPSLNCFSARCCLGTSHRLCQRWRESSVDLIVKIRWKSKLQCFSSYHANWKMCARSSARSCRKFHCRLLATSLHRSALCSLWFAPHLPQMPWMTTFAARWWHSLATSWPKFLFSKANHGSMPYLLVIGVIAGTYSEFSPVRQGHGGVPAAKTQPVGSFGWIWYCSEARHQQPAAPSEHSCGYWEGSCHLFDVQTAA